MSEKLKDLHVSIIAPSAYDDFGRLKQYWKVLMIPPAFAVLDGLANRTARKLNLDISIAHYNERTEKGEKYLDFIIQQDEGFSNSTVFITAKSFEIPRAIDIARRLKRAGKMVVMGGPGITLADWKIYRYLVFEGISFNVGEGENTVGQIIQDVVSGELKPAYWQRDFVDMRETPFPKWPEKDEHKHTIIPFAALGTSEGCPFNCSYCSVIKIRGRKISPDRSRLVGGCADWIWEAHDRGFPVMLTDDNFRMSHTYRLLEEPLVAMNEKLKRKGKRLRLFVQLDARPDIIKEAPRLAAMGVDSAFFGMETWNPLVLAGSNKKQNKPEHYPDIVKAFHKHGINVTSGVMAGFATQNTESILGESKGFGRLLDLPYCYAVTPIPGTDDYADAISKGQLITWDLNYYDGNHFVRNWFEGSPERSAMTIQEAEEAFHDSFFEMFSIRNILRGQGLINRAYGRFLAELGERAFGQPYHIMMDGPRWPFSDSGVRRPADGFRGFALTPEDLEYKDKYLPQIAA